VVTDLDRLRQVVETEARRALAEARIAPDPARLAAGWERRFVTDSSRVAEMVRLYEELGWEAVADPIRPEQLVGDCDDCRVAAQLRFVTIYTRPRRAPAGP
jgi:hypothetical protein